MVFKIPLDPALGQRALAPDTGVYFEPDARLFIVVRLSKSLAPNSLLLLRIICF